MPAVPTPSVAPTLTQPASPQEAPAQAVPEAPTFDVVRVTREGNTVIAGRAEPGAEVTVLDGDMPIAETKADPQGDWVAIPAEPLAPGGRELSVEAQGVGEPEPVASEQVVIVVVPEPNRDVAGNPVEDPKAAGALVVVVPRDDEARATGAGATLLQAPPPPP
ncbi:MAG TPA: peptidoglycan-binding protein, partial [Azospirillaceae bacterium]|nr:peptidoglycan-binding protein [Azospirillaceae bacterium]